MVAALLAGFIARRITEPIARLTNAARAIAPGGLARPAPPTGDGRGEDEIGELGRAFDEMAARLRDVIESLSTDRGRLSAVLAAMDDGVALVDREERVILINRVLAGLHLGEQGLLAADERQVMPGAQRKDQDADPDE